MEERDYFKRQIDLLGKVLSKLLAELIDKKSSAGITNGIEMTNQVLKSELDIEIIDLITIPNDEIIDFLQTKKQLNDENLEQIAEIIMFNIETNSENGMNEISRLNLLQKCLTIYDYVQANDRTYSFERNMKIKKIQSLISK
jgi:hypothetical protein